MKSLLALLLLTHLAHGEDINETFKKLVEKKITQDWKSNDKDFYRRDAHPGGAPLVTASFKASETVPAGLDQHPLFGNKQIREAVVRFSRGTSLDESAGDLSGMAVTVIDKSPISMAMLNDDKFPSKSATSFAELMDATISPPIPAVFKFAKYAIWGGGCPFSRTKDIGIIAGAVSRGSRDQSYLQHRYFSVIAFQFGPTMAKFSFKMEEGPDIPERPSSPKPSFLSDLLKSDLQKQEVKMGMYVQVIPEGSSIDLDDARVGTSEEEIPWQKVGTLTIHKQEITERNKKASENIRFDVAAGMMPVKESSIGQARIHAYDNSSKFRREKNGVQVDSEPKSIKEVWEKLAK